MPKHHAMKAYWESVGFTLIWGVFMPKLLNPSMLDNTWVSLRGSVTSQKFLNFRNTSCFSLGFLIRGISFYSKWRIMYHNLHHVCGCKLCFSSHSPIQLRQAQKHTEHSNNEMKSLITLKLMWLLLDKGLELAWQTFWTQWCWQEKS